jgi:lipid A 3-O-deacylase
MWLSKRALISVFLSLCSSIHCEKELPPDQLMVGLGVFEIMRERYRRPQFQLEYRWDPTPYHVRPLAGVFVTDKGSMYFYGGVGYDIYIGKHVVVTPSFAPGLYFKQNGKELGLPLEFRSCMEASYETKSKHRVGAQFYHISNASLGFRNPGAETLMFFWAFPIHRNKNGPKETL